MISQTAIIYPNVFLGKNCIIDDFCVIGAPPRGCEPGQLPTIIGDNAHIRSHVVIYAGNQIGCNFQAGHKANLRENNRIADDVSIGTLSVVEHHVTIGRGVRIHTQAFVPEYSTLEDECWIGPNVVFTNAKYPTSPNAKHELRGPHVKRGAIITANATLLPGVTIGERALVGAGSVVTRNVPDGMVVVGNPAKVIKRLADLPYGVSRRAAA